MGSEMCIRDRGNGAAPDIAVLCGFNGTAGKGAVACLDFKGEGRCLLYTSDAADERSSVDLGGRRIIKKKKHV